MQYLRMSATAWNLACVLAIACVTAAVVIGAGGNAGSVANNAETSRFSDIFEPSGVQQLPDGRLIVVEDENHNPINLVTFGDSGSLSSRPLAQGSLLDTLVGKNRLGNLKDLEGIDADDNNYVYAITSHSRTMRGNFSNGREKLIRFRVEGDRITEPRVIRNLKKRIIKKYHTLRDAVGILMVGKGKGFNIEGLSFDRKKEKLLIGFRSPVIDGKAVIVVMNNPAAAFERAKKPSFSEQLVMLDLDKGGVRAIVFDATLGGYLIVSRREDKNGKKFKLWFWDGIVGHAPRRVRIPHQEDLKYAEGITPFHRDGRNGILIVFDDGSALERKGGRYLLLSYDQLKIDSTM